MKILLVIHGYPMRYNAGSEVYTQGLAHALASRHEVHVFTRQENSFLPECQLSQERASESSDVTLHLINLARTRDRYRNTKVDYHFGCLIDQIKPDIVHIGHLNHLSTSLVLEAHQRSIPIVFTLHDYWLMCPRGQFIQMYPKNPTDVWALCDGQEDRKCAERCYARYFSGAPEEFETDIAYWTDWVRRRMAHIRKVCEVVDLFIAPSRYLLSRFRDEFGLPPEKLLYVDYGFHRERLTRRQRQPEEQFTFGYIGTHIPAKGIHHLVEAFAALPNRVLLRIWGRNRGFLTESLKILVNSQPDGVGERVEWRGEYQNQDIVSSVFNHCDAIVVPSIWVENSPLVIHEAQQARVPVITADHGGMAEYVQHKVNGLLYQHRDPRSLVKQMQRFVNDPEYAQLLGKRGYLLSQDGNVPKIETHVNALEKIYLELILAKKKKYDPGNHKFYNITSGSLANHL